MFLVVEPARGIDPHTISTFCSGDMTWTTSTCTGIKFSCEDCNIVCLLNIFYLVDDYRQVASYDITNRRLRVETDFGDETIDRTFMKYVFELNGEILIVHFSHHDNNLHCFVSMFDIEEKLWVPLNTLGNRVLFVGGNSFSISAVREEAISNGLLKENIYVLDNVGCNVYFMEGGESVNHIIGSGFSNLDASVDASKELNFWFEPPDYFVNQKQPCVKWGLAMQSSNQELDSLPHFGKVQQRSLHLFEYLLYQPSSSLDPIVVDKIDLVKFDMSYLVASVKVTCKFGWLLSEIPKRDLCNTAFLFYYPLTKKGILLPLLPRPRGSESITATAYYADPDSPQFVFLVLNSYEVDKHVISTFHVGEKGWNTNSVVGMSFPGSTCIVVYVREIFYFVNSSGGVASYNITSGGWKVEGVSDDSEIAAAHMKFAFKLNGELIFIYFLYRDHNLHCHIRRFDWSREVWVQLNSFGNQAVYLGLNSFSVSAVGAAATKNGANKIYILTNMGFNNYSIESGESINCIKCSCFKTEDADINNNKGLNFWIEPATHSVNCKQPTEHGNQTIEDDEVENATVRDQLKRQISDIGDSTAPTKRCGMGSKRKCHRKK